MVVSNFKMRESQVVSSQRIQAVNTNAESSLERYKAYAVFQEIKKKLEEDGESFVKKIGGVFAFKVKDGPDGEEATWIVDVKNGKGCVHNDTGKNSKGCVHNDSKESGLHNCHVGCRPAVLDDRENEPTDSILPGQAEDHREYGNGHEAPESAAAARQSQAVR